MKEDALKDNEITYHNVYEFYKQLQAKYPLTKHLYKVNNKGFEEITDIMKERID